MHINDKYIKIIAGTLSSAIFAESCTHGYYLDYPADEINKLAQTRSVDSNSIAIPLKVQFSDENIEYISFLNELAQDILKDPSVAKEFIKNPQTYINEHGYPIKFSKLDARLTKIILALADEDVCTAIKTHDIGAYLNIMKSKNYIDTLEINDIDRFFLIGDKINFNEDLLTEARIVSAGLFLGPVVVAVCCAVWAVFVEHVLVGNAAAFATVFSAAYAYNAFAKVNGHENVYDSLLNSSYIEIFSLKDTENLDLTIVMDEFIEQSVDDTINYIKLNYPQLTAKYNEKTLKTTILLNIQKTAYE